MKSEALQKIHFHHLTEKIVFSSRTRLKNFLFDQLKHEGKTIRSIDYIFCADDYLLQINQQFLQHNTYTDIITFELSGKNQPLVSEIYISVERVRENASLYNSTFYKELHRVIFHGALHLIGFCDKTKSQLKSMRNMEEEWLSKYFVPRGMRANKINKFPVKR